VNIRLGRKIRGIALIIVLVIIIVLATLAGGFAYTMKVEITLARNSQWETELEWLGRSGVELARYILVQQLTILEEPWDSLNQKWAGGPAGANEVLMDISLEDNELGRGKFSISIVDMERKFNVNLISDPNVFILHRALELSGVDPLQMSSISDAFLDWRDPDDNPRLQGAETEDYLRSPNPGFAPYVAKNGLIDDISELLLIRGITPEMYWGTAVPPSRRFQSDLFVTAGPAGLVDLFTPISSGGININTAPAEVLQLLPGMDASLAEAVVMTRAGMDGVDGTEDDVPFRTPGELINVPGMSPQMVQQLQTLCQTRSQYFQVEVEARIDRASRSFSAMVRRNPANPRDVQVLFFHWKT
jgi:general secretion pathway protein K